MDTSPVGPGTVPAVAVGSRDKTLRTSPVGDRKPWSSLGANVQTPRCSRPRVRSGAFFSISGHSDTIRGNLSHLPSNRERSRLWPDTVAHACSPSYIGG